MSERSSTRCVTSNAPALPPTRIATIVGVVMLWRGAQWTVRDKLLGTFLLPFGPAGATNLVWLNTGEGVCEQVGRDNVGLLLDTFHMNIEEKQVGDALRLGGERLFELHACENDRGTPGSGHVDWDDVFAAVGDTGFDGLVAIESFTPEIEEIARAVSMWRPVAASSDQLARDGLEFLRSGLGAGGGATA